jgi:hypothetical protein
VFLDVEPHDIDLKKIEKIIDEFIIKHKPRSGIECDVGIANGLCGYMSAFLMVERKLRMAWIKDKHKLREKNYLTIRLQDQTKLIFDKIKRRLLRYKTYKQVSRSSRSHHRDNTSTKSEYKRSYLHMDMEN